MPQVTITIPDRVSEMLDAAVRETGESRSGLCAEYIRRGVQDEFERINRYRAYSDRVQQQEKEQQK